MGKLRIIISIAIAIFAVVSIGFSVIFAQSDEGKDVYLSKLATKVAVILGLDAAEVDAAIKQARIELSNEAIGKKLRVAEENGDITRKEADLKALVEAGEITQDEADKKLEGFKMKEDFSWKIEKKELRSNQSAK